TQRIAAEDAAGAVDFFKTSVPLAFASVSDAALQGEFKSANAAAAASMSAYAAWIKSLKPSGSFAIGSGAYRRRLLYEDGLDMPLDQYLAVGEKALAATREQFIATARKINPKASPLAVYLSITRIHPAPDALLATAQRDLGLLRAFVEAKQLITRRPMRTSRWSRRPPSSGRRPALPRTLRVRSRPSPPRPTTT
ncbi:MAG TPA: DUF885 family protein, partial [Candidatus Dormibacteraeota bacterium]|nr:DUF885 family protein [Candidatus Dormibacteraeota bacterium]